MDNYCNYHFAVVNDYINFLIMCQISTKNKRYNTLTGKQHTLVKFKSNVNIHLFSVGLFSFVGFVVNLLNRPRSASEKVRPKELLFVRF
jgi:hypothetical protein